jgi:hypothetical protein
MKIVPPLTITDARFVSSTVAEPASGETAWVSAATYTAGDVRIRTQTHRRYQALVNHTGITTAPELDPTRWSDVGPTMRWAMFDYDRNTATETTGSLTATIAPSARVTALLLFGIDAQQVVVTVRTGSVSGPVVYTATFNLQTRFVATWQSHFFANFIFRESLVLFNLPPYINAYIAVQLSKTVGTDPVALESMIVGAPVEIGQLEYGAESDILDFSRVDRDAFGNATLVPRKNVPKLNARVLVAKEDVPAIRKLRQDFAGKPVAFIGIEDGSDAYFDSLSLVGIFKRMTVAVEYPNESLINIEAEGL